MNYVYVGIFLCTVLNLYASWQIKAMNEQTGEVLRILHEENMDILERLERQRQLTDRSKML